MYFISSKSNKSFYLCLLLINVYKSTLFKNLHTIKMLINDNLNNKIYKRVFDTYKKICITLELTNNNNK